MKESPMLRLGLALAVLCTAAAALAQGPYSYYPLEPCRITPVAGLTAGAPVAYQITGQCAVPSDAKVAALNLTVAAPAGDGFIKVWQYGASQPAVSNLNYSASDTAVANSATVHLSSDGRLSAVAGVSSVGTFIIDVQGYYK
jgi:hypothetical protein